jgi:ubiquinone/menaquinone biosynthesis C-methylase UbiE
VYIEKFLILFQIKKKFKSMTKFLDPSAVVAHAQFQTGDTVANLGCGGGYFAVAASREVKDTGTVYAVDVQESQLEATQSTARHERCKNITVMRADLDKPFTELPESSCQGVIIGSIIHEVGSRQMLFENAYRLLQTGGRLLVIEWQKKAAPVGPPINVRIAEDDLIAELQRMGLRLLSKIPADDFHYALLFTK